MTDCENSESKERMPSASINAQLQATSISKFSRLSSCMRVTKKSGEKGLTGQSIKRYTKCVSILAVESLLLVLSRAEAEY